MQLAREIRLGISILIVLNLVISFGAITLLGRTTPATEASLQENVVSTEAIQRMLSVLTSPRIRDDSTWIEFENAFVRAHENISEPEEAPILAEIRTFAEEARAGDPQAKASLVAALQRLGEINRSTMARRSEQAKRLGLAGGWAIVFMGFLSFLTGGVVLRRFLRRISLPVEEVAEVLKAWRHGEVQRRCRRMSASRELTDAINNINFLLDDEVKPLFDRETALRAKDLETRDRRIIHDLLEKLPGSAIIVSEHGEIVAANTSGLDALSGPNGENLRNEIAHPSPVTSELGDSNCRLYTKS